MVIVRKALPDSHLLIAGDGSARQSLEQLADSLGLRARESFLGWLEDESLQMAYKASWVLVLPSVVEDGFPTVLSEAGLMGRPVVASNIGGIKDIIQHGENGLLVPPGNAMALSDAIVMVLQDPLMAQQMGLAGSSCARERLQGREEAIERVRQAIYGFLHDEVK
jgi:glycosyltransferase involved in cell wall biosynthesis